MFYNNIQLDILSPFLNKEVHKENNKIIIPSQTGFNFYNNL